MHRILRTEVAVPTSMHDKKERREPCNLNGNFHYHYAVMQSEVTVTAVMGSRVTTTMVMLMPVTITSNIGFIDKSFLEDHWGCRRLIGQETESTPVFRSEGGILNWNDSIRITWTVFRECFLDDELILIGGLIKGHWNAGYASPLESIQSCEIPLKDNSLRPSRIYTDPKISSSFN